MFHRSGSGDTRVRVKDRVEWKSALVEGEEKGTKWREEEKEGGERTYLRLAVSTKNFCRNKH